MAMAAPPSRPFLLLCESAVYSGEETTVECSSKAAYGCGPFGEQIVEGLTLFTRLDDRGPALGVLATDEVLRRLEEEVPGELANIWGSDQTGHKMAEVHGTEPRLCGSAQVVDDDAGLVVLRVSFLMPYEYRDFRSYYLVYDSAAASLSLLPSLPPHCPAVGTTRPLPVRRDDGGYSLVLMAVNSKPQTTDDLSERPVLCLWSPPPVSAPESTSHEHSHSDDHGVGPWRIRPRRHDTAIPAKFFGRFAQLHVFTYKGKAFWADVTQGILYCDCADLLSGGGEDAPAVEFTFVALPEEYTIETLEYKHRAMGVGVGDSVWFVVLESCDHPGDTTMVVLSLDLSAGAVERKWERRLELSLLSIWALEGFVEAGLPRRVPWSPFLREQEAGVIYLLLPPADMNFERGCHLIAIDVRDSSEPRLLLPPRRLTGTIGQQPLFLSPDFFDRRGNQEEALS